jgi:hypothetical protein
MIVQSRRKEGEMPDEPKSRPPARSRQQRLQALQQANEIRQARAQLKRELAAGTADLALILTQPPAFLATMRVHDLLLMLPKIGPVRAGRILSQSQISQNRTVGGLSERQRSALTERLRDRAPPGSYEARSP